MLRCHPCAFTSSLDLPGSSCTWPEPTAALGHREQRVCELSELGCLSCDDVHVHTPHSRGR